MGSFRLIIYRYEPCVGKEAVYEEYDLIFDHNPTVLEALKIIQEDYDPSLAFRESCGLGKCGSCSVNLNGKPVLACQTRLEEEVEYVVEPLQNHPIIKDLVIDRSNFESSMIKDRVFHVHDFTTKEKSFSWPLNFYPINQCTECLICQDACPSLALNPSQFSGPAVYLQLSKSMNHPLSISDEPLIAWTEGIQNCTACMTCSHVCPKGVDPFTNGVISLRNKIINQQLPLPDSQSKLRKQYISSGKLAINKDSKIVHNMIQENVPVGLFLGCMFSDQYPDEGLKVLDLLSKLDIKVLLPEGLKCCGGPLLWLGDQKSFEESVIHNIQCFLNSGVKKVITPCPGCGLTFKSRYAQVWQEKTGKELPFEVLDLLEFLKEDSYRIPIQSHDSIKVTYHSPCHHGKGQGLIDSSLRILKQDPNIELLDFSSMENCCGGMLASSNSTMALEMSSIIVEDAERLNADYLVTACIFCRNNLSKAARKIKSKVQVDHLLSFSSCHCNVKKGNQGSEK